MIFVTDTTRKFKGHGYKYGHSYGGFGGHGYKYGHSYGGYGGYGKRSADSGEDNIIDPAESDRRIADPEADAKAGFGLGGYGLGGLGGFGFGGLGGYGLGGLGLGYGNVLLLNVICIDEIIFYARRIWRIWRTVWRWSVWPWSLWWLWTLVDQLSKLIKPSVHYN